MQVAANGNSPQAVEFVPPELLNEISEVFETEGMMDQPAERRIIDAINEGLRPLHLENKAMATELRELREEFKDTKRDVTELKDWKRTIVEEKQSTSRTIKHTVIQWGVAAILGGLLTLAVARYTAPPVATAPQQDAISGQLRELIEEIRTDRAYKEQQPAPPAETPRRTNRPRRAAPAPPQGPGARYQNGDVLADPNLRARLWPPIQEMEWRQ